MSVTLRGHVPHLEYSHREEQLNIASHFIGMVLSIIGTVLLAVRAFSDGTLVHQISFLVYGGSLILLYFASTIYHSALDETVRHRLKILDHAAIYILIAGSYTPITVTVMEGWVGWLIFGIVWGMALLGVLLKLKFTGRFNRLSTLLYVFMGWMIVFAINPLIEALPPEGLYWLVAGGIAYTVGALLYSMPFLPMHHAIFHIFVVIGSACQFVTVYCYIIE